MLHLALSIISGVAFLQLLRTGQHNRADQMILIWANYAVAAILSYVLILSSGEGIGRIDPVLVVARITNGALYVVHLLIVVATVRLVGTGVASAIMSSGNVVGVLMAWILWGEGLNLPQWGAVAVMPVALLLMRTPSAVGFKHSWRTDGILLANFTLVGVIATIHKGISLDNPYHGRLVYQFLIFAVALVLTTVVVIRNRQRPSSVDLVLGAAAGIANVASTLFLLFALNALLAAVVLPSRSSLSILLSLALGWMLWRESVTGRQLLGAGLAIVTVVLANLP